MAHSALLPELAQNCFNCLYTRDNFFCSQSKRCLDLQTDITTLCPKEPIITDFFNCNKFEPCNTTDTQRDIMITESQARTKLYTVQAQKQCTILIANVQTEGLPYKPTDRKAYFNLSAADPTILKLFKSSTKQGLTP